MKQEENQNQTLAKVNNLLEALELHMDNHPGCCLKKLLNSLNGDNNQIV